jgi:hypothetical protein
MKPQDIGPGAVTHSAIAHAESATRRVAFFWLASERGTGAISAVFENDD